MLMKYILHFIKARMCSRGYEFEQNGRSKTAFAKNRQIWGQGCKNFGPIKSNFVEFIRFDPLIK